VIPPGAERASVQDAGADARMPVFYIPSNLNTSRHLISCPPSRPCKITPVGLPTAELPAQDAAAVAAAHVNVLSVSLC
jgi:hypothetical protein